MELIQVKQGIGNSPWLLCGDFNAMISSEEKLGGSTLSETDTKDFNDFIEEYHSPAQIAIYDECIHGKKPFRFFKMWTNHPSYVPTVSDVWKEIVQGCKMFSVCKKLKLLKEAIKTLNRNNFYNISEQVQRARDALENTQRELQAHLLHPMLISQEKENISKYNTLVDCEMSFYQQKARVKWNLQGDRYTSLFHNIAKSRKHNNRVVALYNNLGVKITEPEGIVNEFISFYKNLMGTVVSSTPLDKSIIKSGLCLSPSQANALGAPVTKDEIKATIFSISKSKAPGPDGYSMSFFKSSWPIIGEEIILAVQEFFRNGNLLVLANRMKTVMGYLVNEAQSAFVKRRKNISPRAMVNIDIKKAFDTISWGFISDLLLGLGFPDSMIKWVMACITSPRYSISLNGSLHGYFKGERGLRWKSSDWNQCLNWFSNSLRGKGINQKLKRMVMVTTIYILWRERNRRLFQGTSKGANAVIKEIKMEILYVALNNLDCVKDQCNLSFS
ncbi:uncharacterized protein LOC109821446 [Asparagus officinalis]|uniref:uncharacterized protein LOC109821446 n=1 Tax=Asparagus officinalis TaxID=4686 RepID=UPI00098E6303|nr:uncharacterized protein LOC109821446 [Asparagus officinalis]